MVDRQIDDDSSPSLFSLLLLFLVGYGLIQIFASVIELNFGTMKIFGINVSEGWIIFVILGGILIFLLRGRRSKGDLSDRIS